MAFNRHVVSVIVDGLNPLKQGLKLPWPVKIIRGYDG